MAGILAADRIIESEKINQKLQSIGNEVSKLITAFDKVAESGDKLAKSLGGADNLNKIIKASQETAKATEELTFNQAELAKQAQELGKLTAKLEEIESSYNKEIIKTKEAIKQKNAAIKEEITGEKAAANAKKAATEASRQKAAEEKKAAAATKLTAQEEKLKLAVQAQTEGTIRRLQAENQLHAFTIKNKLNPAIAEERAEILRLNQVIATNKDSISDMQRKNVTAWDRVTKSVGQHLLAYVGFTQIVQVLTNIFNLTKKLDSLQFTMKTVIKDQNELAKTQLFLSETSSNYGLDLINLTERYVKFRTAAMQSNLSAKETMTIFNSTAKAAAVLGLATDEVGGVFLALEQMLSKGKVTTEELRRQLGERLPGAFGIMADALGVTLPQLDKMLKAGEVLSNEALPKFAAALEKAYGIESVNMIDTLTAAQGRLATSWTKFVDDLQASGVYKFMLNQANNTIIAIQDTFGSTSKILERLSRQTDYVGDKVRTMITELDKVPYEKLIGQQKQLGDHWIEYLDDWNVHTKEAELLFNQYIQRRKTQLEKDNANSKKIKPFDLNEYEKILDSAKTEFERFQVIKDETLKDQFTKTASFYKEDQKNYKDYLNNQIKIFADKTRIAEGLFKVEEAAQESMKISGKEITKEQRQELSNRYENYLNYVNASAVLQQKLAEVEKPTKIEVKQAKDKAKYLSDVSKDYNDMMFRLAKDRQKEELDAEKDLANEIKRIKKQAAEEQAAFTNETISNSLAAADEEKLKAQEVAQSDIKAARNKKDEIQKIQHELTLFMIDEDIKAQERILNTGGLEADAYEAASKRIRQLRLQRGEEDITWTEKTEEEKDQIRQAYFQSSAALLSKGLEFSQQIYSAQAERAQATYDAEVEAAGDSLEAQTLAKRKFEAEDKKIKQRQAIASKLQAVLDASLALAMAIATTWKNPILAALNISAASAGLAMALATPIPQFYKGTKDAPETFIAGDTPDGKGASEMIIKPSGEMILTPPKATLFSDKSFIGSTILPKDKTQEMLNNYAINGGSQVFVDMSKSEKSLDIIAKNTRNNEQRFVNANGNTVVKKGFICTTYR